MKTIDNIYSVLENNLIKLDNLVDSFIDYDRLDKVVDFFTNKVSDDLTLSFIDGYRSIIRNNNWSHLVLEEKPLNEFIKIWVNVHLLYVKKAIDNFEIIYCNNLSANLIDKLYDNSILAELYRASIGKRSENGLDHRLDRKIIELETILNPYQMKIDIDGLMCNVVSEIRPPLISAEREMFNSFRSFQLSKVNDESKSIVFKRNILKNFCRFNLRDFNSKFRLILDSNIINDSKLEFKKYEDSILEKYNLCNYLISTDRVKELITEIQVLSYLNCNAEVKYGFKNWAGLVHYLVFLKKESIDTNYFEIKSKEFANKYKYCNYEEAFQ